MDPVSKLRIGFSVVLVSAGIQVPEVSARDSCVEFFEPLAERISVQQWSGLITQGVHQGQFRPLDFDAFFKAATPEQREALTGVLTEFDRLSLERKLTRQKVSGLYEKLARILNQNPDVSPVIQRLERLVATQNLIDSLEHAQLLASPSAFRATIDSLTTGSHGHWTQLVLMAALNSSIFLSDFGVPAILAYQIRLTPHEIREIAALMRTHGAKAIEEPLRRRFGSRVMAEKITGVVAQLTSAVGLGVLGYHGFAYLKLKNNRVREDQRHLRAAAKGQEPLFPEIESRSEPVADLSVVALEAELRERMQRKGRSPEQVERELKRLREAFEDQADKSATLPE